MTVKKYLLLIFIGLTACPSEVLNLTESEPKSFSSVLPAFEPLKIASIDGIEMNSSLEIELKHRLYTYVDNHPSDSVRVSFRSKLPNLLLSYRSSREMHGRPVALGTIIMPAHDQLSRVDVVPIVFFDPMFFANPSEEDGQWIWKNLERTSMEYIDYLNHVSP